MSSQPLVSLGIPVYQGERYIAQALSCACSQTYRNLEICVSDNASTDATLEICQDFARRDPRIRLEVTDRNRGSAWNFNHVVSMAHGEYFKWLAADDLIAPRYVERVVERLQQPDRPAWAHSRFARIYATDTCADLDSLQLEHARARSMLSDQKTSFCRTSSRASDRFRAILLGPTWIEDNYGLIRRDLLLRTRLELPFYGSEKVMLAELALLGHYAEVPELLAFSRTHAEASAMLPTAAAQQEFVAPGETRGGSTWKLRRALLHGFRTAISRHPITRAEKRRCWMTLIAYSLQFKKWPHVLRQLLRGKAVRSPEASETPESLASSIRDTASQRQ